MRVLFVVPLPVESPSVRFRVYQFLGYLRNHGVDAVVRPFLSSRLAPIAFAPGRTLAKALVFFQATLRRCLDVAGGRRWDVVWVHRDAFPFGPPIFEAILKRLAGRLIFDFDDAIYLRSGIYRTLWDRLKDLDKPRRVIGLADHVVVGNAHLGQYARQFSPRVTVLPTVVDTDHYRPRPAPAPGPPTIGWIGTPSSAAYLEWLVPAFRRLAARVDVRFHFVGSTPFAADGLAVRFTPWSLAHEPALLHGFDVGVMPLFDDEEARGKCGLKLLQYMAVAVPGVASPVGANLEIVRHGENGLLAGDEAEWVDALARLAAAPALRTRLGVAGRRTVEERYSVRVVAPRLLALLEAVRGGA